MMANNKPILLIDQDDVLAEYILGVTVAFNKKYGTHLRAEDCDSWDLCSVFGETIDTVMHEPELFRSLLPAKNALEVFERLYHSNLFEMYIVTAANPKTVEAKYEWIASYLPFFPQSRIIVCSHKFMIKGDFLLDDGMHNIQDFFNTGGTPIVFERPHNAHLKHQFKTVQNWIDFEKFIINTCYLDKENEYFEFEIEKAI
jgi:5'(3')-deoxyribonucleotidase